MRMRFRVVGCFCGVGGGGPEYPVVQSMGLATQTGLAPAKKSVRNKSVSAMANCYANLLPECGTEFALVVRIRVVGGKAGAIFSCVSVRHLRRGFIEGCGCVVKY